MTADQRMTYRFTIVVPLVLALLSMIGPFTVDTPFPAFVEMGADFHVGKDALQWIVTVYLVSFAAMSVLHGPLSDAVGRRPVMMVSISVYVLASIGCALSPNLATLLVFRALQGLSAGGSTIVSRTIIRDMFEGAQAQRLMSRVAIIFGVGPAIGPIVGGLLLQWGEWHLIFFFLAGWGVTLVLLVLLVLPETHPPENRVPLRVGEILGGLIEVGRLPAFHRLSWAMALIFGAQFLYIGGAAIFVVDVLGEGELDFWKLFVPMIGSMMLGSWICGRAAGRISARRMVSIGATTAFSGSVVGVVLAATGAGDVFPWAVVGLGLIALGNGMAFPTLQLLLLDQFPRRRGAVVSLSSFLTLVVNAFTAAAFTPLVGASALGFAVTALAMVGAGQLCWAWHCAIEDRDSAVPEGTADLEPTDLL